MKSRPLTLPRLVDSIDAKAPPPPPDRGRLIYDFEIPDLYYRGLPGITKKLRWVREHFPRGKRVKIGGSSAWYEKDILEHLERERGATRAAG